MGKCLKPHTQQQQKQQLEETDKEKHAKENCHYNYFLWQTLIM